MAKMSRSNTKARIWMEANGYTDIFFTPHTRWSKDIIVQGEAFDGLASHGSNLVLFQVKSNSKPTKKLVSKFDSLSDRFGAEFLFFNSIDRHPLEINNLSAEKFLIKSPQLKL